MTAQEKVVQIGVPDERERRRRRYELLAAFLLLLLVLGGTWTQLTLYRGQFMDVHRPAEHQFHFHADRAFSGGAQCGQADHGAAAESLRRANPYPSRRRFRFPFFDPHRDHVFGIEPGGRHQRGLLVHPADGKLSSSCAGCGAAALCSRSGTLRFPDPTPS